jgi:predicted molibdopterin-dependent oxidoreductase YjgC
LLQAGFTQRDLEKVPFIASLHILANAGAELSNVVLPGTAYPEKRGSMINVTGRLQRLNRAVKAPGNANNAMVLPAVAFSMSNAFGPMEQPLPSTSTNSCRVPAGSLSPTLIIDFLTLGR